MWKKEIMEKEEMTTKSLEESIVMKMGILNCYRVMFGFTEPWVARKFSYKTPKQPTDFWDIQLALNRISETLDRAIIYLSQSNASEKDKIEDYIRRTEFSVNMIIDYYEEKEQ